MLNPRERCPRCGFTRPDGKPCECPKFPSWWRRWVDRWVFGIR